MIKLNTLLKVIRYNKHRPSEYTSDLKGLWFVLEFDKLFINSGERNGTVPAIVLVPVSSFFICLPLPMSQILNSNVSISVINIFSGFISQ